MARYGSDLSGWEFEQLEISVQLKNFNSNFCINSLVELADQSDTAISVKFAESHLPNPGPTAWEISHWASKFKASVGEWN